MYYNLLIFFCHCNIWYNATEAKKPCQTVGRIHLQAPEIEEDKEQTTKPTRECEPSEQNAMLLSKDVFVAEPKEIQLRRRQIIRSVGEVVEPYRQSSHTSRRCDSCAITELYEPKSWQSSQSHRRVIRAEIGVVEQYFFESRRIILFCLNLKMKPKDVGQFQLSFTFLL